jgi:hypothetical protein
MDVNKHAATLALAVVEPFTGEPGTFPPQTAPVPLMRSQAQYHTAMTVQRPRHLAWIMRKESVQIKLTI